MTKEERLLRQEQRERAKAIEAAAREAGRKRLTALQDVIDWAAAATAVPAKPGLAAA